MDKNETKTITEDKKNAQNPPNTPPKKPLNKPKGANDDFKRRYFDYYDDIKISDRQDW